MLVVVVALGAKGWCELPVVVAADLEGSCAPGRRERRVDVSVAAAAVVWASVVVSFVSSVVSGGSVSSPEDVGLAGANRRSMSCMSSSSSSSSESATPAGCFPSTALACVSS